MCLRARSWGFVIRCPRFLVGVKVGSPTMMMSMFLERLAAIVFGVMSVGSSGKRLSHWFISVSGSCVGYWWCSCVSRCCTAVCASGFVSL
jgi:hypothetical protein